MTHISPPQWKSVRKSQCTPTSLFLQTMDESKTWIHGHLMQSNTQGLLCISTEALIANIYEFAFLNRINWINSVNRTIVGQPRRYIWSNNNGGYIEKWVLWQILSKTTFFEIKRYHKAKLHLIQYQQNRIWRIRLQDTFSRHGSLRTHWTFSTVNEWT